MRDQSGTSPRIVLAFGWRERLASETTSYADATLERLLPALMMPNAEAFDLVERMRREAHARVVSDSWRSYEEANEAPDDLMRSFFGHQKFLQRQALDFAFVAVFQLLERAVQKILLLADNRHRGSILHGKDVPREFGEMTGILAQCGYAIAELPFANNLWKLNLISNAVKHGHGPSLTRLEKQYPDLFLYRTSDEQLTPEHLFLSQDLLRELTASVAAFWNSFPSQTFA